MSLIDLTKKVDIVLTKRNAPSVICKVGFAADTSGSMSSFYSSYGNEPSAMQDILDRMVAVAMKFDDDATLDFWAFDVQGYELPAVTEKNHATYIQKQIKGNRQLDWGGTEYTPILANIAKAYSTNRATGFFKALFGKKPAEKSLPAFVIFLTDGESNTNKGLNEVLEKLSDSNVYVQTIGIGHLSFGTLRILENNHDNVGFFAIDDIAKISDESLYENLISEKFIEWYTSKSFE